MTAEEFRALLTTEQLPADLTEPLRVLWLDYRGAPPQFPLPGTPPR